MTELGSPWGIAKILVFLSSSEFGEMPRKSPKDVKQWFFLKNFVFYQRKQLLCTKAIAGKNSHAE